MFPLDSSAIIALPITFISVFCLLIEAKQQYIITSAGVAGLILALTIYLRFQKDYSCDAEVSWQRIEEIHQLLSHVLDTSCSLVLIYHYGKNLSERDWAKGNFNDGVIDALERRIAQLTAGWSEAYLSGEHLYRLEASHQSSHFEESICGHPVCFFLRGYAERCLENAASRGVLERGRYVVRTCKESILIIDV